MSGIWTIEKGGSMEASATVRVPLTVEEQAERAGQMARLIARIEGVEDEAKEQASIFREEIKGLEAELRSIAAGVREGVVEKAQMDLTFTQAQAAAALAGVGAAACTCTSEDIADPACPVHGVETRGENAAVDEQGPILVEPVAEVAADYVVPAAAEVDVPAPETPLVVEDFIAAQKARRRKRA